MNEPLTTLGQTEVQIPWLGIGTWQWGDTMMWGYGKGYAGDDLRAAFAAAIAGGGRFFDTAEVYGMGRSERFLGQFIHERGLEKEVIVATKFFPFPWRFSRQQLLAALRRSLQRLGLDRVDLYQLHWPSPPVPVERWAEALADTVEAGLTRAVGVSNYNADQLRAAHAVLAKRGIPLASNQVHYSLLHRAPERDGVLAACRDLGVTLIAYSPLAKGVLTGKYTPEHPLPGLRGRLYNRHLAELQPLLTRLREIGAAHGGKTPAQVALNWLICQGTVPIPGAKNARQVESNLGALGWRLTADEVATLTALSEEVQT